MLLKLSLVQLNVANPNQGAISLGGGILKRNIRIVSLEQRVHNVLLLPPESKIPAKKPEPVNTSRSRR